MKHDVFGGIFWGVYTQAEHLRVWILHGDWLNDSLRYFC